MKAWFFSHKGAVALTAAAWLTEVWRGYLDAMFVFPVDFNDDMTMNLAALIAAVLFGGWAWALARAARGSRGGLIAAFGLNALVWFAIPVSWLFFYCPAACRAGAGIFNLANTLNLVFGLLAGVGLGAQLTRKSRNTVVPGVLEGSGSHGD